MVRKFKLYEKSNDVFVQAALLTFFLPFCDFLTSFRTHNYQEFLDINTETFVRISTRPYVTFLHIPDLILLLNSSLFKGCRKMHAILVLHRSEVLQ